MGNILLSGNNPEENEEEISDINYQEIIKNNIELYRNDNKGKNNNKILYEEEYDISMEQIIKNYMLSFDMILSGEIKGENLGLRYIYTVLLSGININNLLKSNIELNISNNPQLLVAYIIACNKYIEKRIPNYGKIRKYSDIKDLSERKNSKNFSDYIDILHIDSYSIKNLSNLYLIKLFTGLESNNYILEEVIRIIRIRLKESGLNNFIPDFIFMLGKNTTLKQLNILNNFVRVNNIMNHGDDIFLDTIKDIINFLLNQNKSQFFKYSGKALLYLIENKNIPKNNNISKDYILQENNLGKGLINLKNGIFESYSEVISDSDIDILGNIDIKEQSAFMQEMHSPEMIYMINQDLKIDITNLTLQVQFHLLRFLWDQTIEEFEKFKQTLLKISGEENKYTFLTIFLACSEDIELGDKIIELAGYPGAEAIFKAYANLVNLQGEVDNNSIDMLSFLKVILERGKGLLLDAIEDGKDGDTLDIDSKYGKSLVKSGAFAKALFKSQKKGEIMNMQEFNDKSPDFEVGTFNGGNLIKSGENIDMLMEENYLNENNFGKDDYIMLLENISGTYSGIDDELIKILTKDIPNDLNNPNVKFYIMREKIKSGKKGELLAICKITKKEDGYIYWGTHYVESEYRGNFGIGSYIAKLAFNDFKKYDINASITKNNSSLEMQINHLNFVGINLYKYQSYGLESNGVIGVKYFKNKIFKTKNKNNYPDRLLKNQIGKQINYEVKCLDSRPGFDDIYISTLENMFSKGYVLTRIFYEKDKKGSNLEKTYVVFEKIPINKEENIQNDLKIAN